MDLPHDAKGPLTCGHLISCSPVPLFNSASGHHHGFHIRWRVKKVGTTVLARWAVRRFTSVASCIAVLILCVSGCVRQGQCDAWSRRASVDVLWSRLARDYAYFESAREGEEHRKAAQKLMDQVATRREYIEALATELNTLNDPHVQLTNLGEYWRRSTGNDLRPAYRALYNYGGCYWVGFAPEAIVRTEASPTLPDQALYQLVSVCGIPAGTLAMQLLRSEPGIQIRVNVLAMDGNVYALDVQVPMPEHVTATRPNTSQPAEAARAHRRHPPRSKVHARRFDDLGYIRIDELDDERVVKDFDEALDGLEDTKALILDLRGNGGGEWDCAKAVLARFVATTAPYGYMQFPHGGILPGVGLRLWHSLPMVVKPRGKTYRRPIVVLIDTTTVSSAELLTMGLKDLCDATLVGHHTAGASAGVLEVTLPDGLKVSYSAFPTRRLDNRTYQYVGIAPDVEFEVNRARICREGWIGVMTQHADEVTKAREIAAAKAKLWSGE